jgi:hypothetical protein
MALAGSYPVLDRGGSWILGTRDETCRGGVVDGRRDLGIRNDGREG